MEWKLRLSQFFSLVVLCLIIFFTSHAIDSDLSQYHKELLDIPAREALGGAILGFREIVADLLWLKVTQWYQSPDWSRIVPTMKIIVRLTPHWLTVWKMLGWHLAYNVYARTKDPFKKALLVEEGIQVLKEGLNKNPDKYDLYFEIGWTYFYKTRDYDKAAFYFEAATKFPERPNYVDHMLAHSLERAGRLEEALKVWEKLYITRRNFDKSPLEEEIVSRFIRRLREKIKERETL